MFRNLSHHSSELIHFLVDLSILIFLTSGLFLGWSLGANDAATVVGFFGAGGMGWYLKRNVLQVETKRVAAILLSIIILVLVSELFSAFARERAMKMK